MLTTYNLKCKKRHDTLKHQLSPLENMFAKRTQTPAEIPESQVACLKDTSSIRFSTDSVIAPERIAPSSLETPVPGIKCNTELQSS